jgi:excisionase family DNA binding protein
VQNLKTAAQPLDAMAFKRSTPIADLPEFLTIPQAAWYLGISSGLCYEMAKSETLRTCRLGRLLRVPRSALEALAAIKSE